MQYPAVSLAGIAAGGLSVKPHMTLRKELRNQLTERFIPELSRIGFVGPNKISGNGIIHEFKRTNSKVTQILDIQFEKYGLARFVINLTISPNEGVETLIENGGTIVAGRVQARPGPSTRHWFRADRPLWGRIFGKTSNRVFDAVSDALATLEEIEQWWENPSPSRHIIDSNVTYPDRS